MPLRTFTITSLPGEPGFVDEVNSVFMTLAGYANKTVRIEFRALDFSGKKTIGHKLGVKPDFVFQVDDTTGINRVGVVQYTESDKASWTDRHITIDVQEPAYIGIVALT